MMGAIKVAGVLVGMGCAMTVFGVQPNPTEKAAARLWLKDRLLSTTQPAFSFLCGGKPFRDSLVEWQKTIAEEMGADGRVIHTVTFFDPKTKLSVRCIATEFPGSSAVDWVLRLENKSSGPTPIIEDLLPLDVAVAAPQKDALTLTSTTGDRNSGASFAPHDERIPLGEQRAFSAPCGCSSNANLPFFNFALPNGGVALAIGWSGRWEAHFGRAGDGAITLKAGQ